MYFPQLHRLVLDEPGEQNPLLIQQPPAQPGRDSLRHLLIGSPDGVRATIHRLHLLHYAEQSVWSRLIAIPPSGIVLTPAQGEVFSYWLRSAPMRHR
ncbi:MAG: hypothetical protein KME20_04880 [Kaiparowitsia implicata GSE-PSE-MK54-09C]|jgi:hypothetical protein|nr:hypothetical protein [Kaiparowitsia implicata GSE-PSE-MK54-09C]